MVRGVVVDLAEEEQVAIALDAQDELDGRAQGGETGGGGAPEPGARAGDDDRPPRERVDGQVTPGGPARGVAQPRVPGDDEPVERGVDEAR